MDHHFRGQAWDGETAEWVGQAADAVGLRSGPQSENDNVATTYALIAAVLLFIFIRPRLAPCAGQLR